MKRFPFVIGLILFLNVVNGQIDPSKITIVRDSFGIPSSEERR